MSSHPTPPSVVGSATTLRVSDAPVAVALATGDPWRTAARIYARGAIRLARADKARALAEGRDAGRQVADVVRTSHG